MKNSTRIAISLLSLAVVPFVSGCGSSTEQVKETTASTDLCSDATSGGCRPAGSARSGAAANDSNNH